jgi:hypothetical protein
MRRAGWRGSTAPPAVVIKDERTQEGKRQDFLPPLTLTPSLAACDQEAMRPVRVMRLPTITVATKNTKAQRKTASRARPG